MTRVAILWHMHQPYYEDLVTGEHILPWVRMHALKDYWGMARLLAEFPDLRVTFNLVPSLLIQLEAFAGGRARDPYLETGMKPADALTPDDVRFMLRNFFHAQRQRMIDAHPRYAELLSLRGWSITDDELEGALRRFTLGDLRDLQVWQKLAWIDPEYQAHDPRIRRLLTQGRHFTEDDKQELRTVELEILNQVIPEYRERQEQGQIEISTSPFYHPILPLLCDTGVYRSERPDAGLPQPAFRHPVDALAQLERAAAYHETLFGRRPAGVWPSEGSVSEAMVPLVAGAGFRWMATDELILARTLSIPFARDEQGRVSHADRLYRSYVVAAGGAQVACGFRDHALSDLIGFSYAGWPSDAAAEDFTRRLVEAGRQAQETGWSGEEPTVFVILDGENAWEHFDGGGRPFLRALYGRLSRHPELRAVTMADACAAPTSRLHGIVPGSWIDGSFYIWIGHDDDVRAWNQLTAARQLLDETVASADPGDFERAREEVFIAEGSDWCWWYGDDHSSDQDAEFDELFRRHLRNVYQLLGQPIPDELFVTNITTSDLPLTVAAPSGLLNPTIDGEETSYFEWLGAGTVEARPTGGAMHQVGQTPLVAGIRFGFDRTMLFVRIDIDEDSAVDLLSNGTRIELAFLRPAGIRVVLRASGDDGVRILAFRPRADGGTEDLPTAAVQAAAHTIAEIAVPLDWLAAYGAGNELPLTEVVFFVTVLDARGMAIERHPVGRPIAAAVPDAQFAARHWTA
jgi:alpha-amylase/alpha-mannosidase (GH57 family)